MIGQTVGKYRISDRLGRGGMGTVYKAMDEMLHRDVAIKVLNAELNDPEVARRFRAEAITVARLSHPGIANIYELFEHEGEWLMVMEFVRGETLESTINRMGQLSVPRAADVCMQALAALAHAHSLGVVHRDLKPANLMVTENGSIKVMDFGIARVAGTEHLTNAGFMMGTPAYMAPEQVKGGDIDARADLYALGVVFYRLVTGRLPFNGETPFAMVQSQVNDPPTPVSMVRADLPPWVGDVIGRALSKAPDQRFQSAAEFHEAFARCLAGLPLSSMYAAPAGGDPTLTPSRAMSTAAFQQRPVHATPAGGFYTGSHPTMAAPGTSPNAVSSPQDQTMLATPVGMPTAATPAAAPGTGAGAGVVAGAGTGTTAGVSTGTQTVVVKKSIPMSVVAIMVAAVLVGSVAVAWIMRGGRTSPPATGASDAALAELPPPVGAGAGGDAVSGSGGAASDPAGGMGVGGTGVVGPATPGQPGTGTQQQGATPAPITPGGGGATSPTGAAGANTPAPGARAGASGAPAGRTGTPGTAGAATGTGTSGTAGATSGAANPAASTAKPAATGGATAAPGASDALVTFPGARLYTITEGRRTRNVEVVLNFAAGHVLVMPRSGGAAVATVPYKAIVSAIYFRGRDPRWNADLAFAPDGVDVGSALRTSHNWLVVQGKEQYGILRLDDSNAERILETLEARTGVKVDRQK